MPIGLYYTYKCLQCGYRFTKFKGDVLTPEDIDIKCPKCGGEVKVIKRSPIPFKTSSNTFIKLFQKLFKDKR